jgi:three-Cys-motif partner protein
MGRQKQDAKTNVLPHTKAKLELYKNYLDKYLAILGAATWINKINIFDIFCGTGIYNDGKAGSPVLAFETIERNREFCRGKGWRPKPILLCVNDGNPQHVEKVQRLLTALNKDICELDFNTLSAKEMLQQVKTKIKKQRSNERNLIFIDPYGYQDIHKEDLIGLLNTRKTEVILFLPIAHMYRFKKIAVEDYENPSFVKLREFIYDFFPPEHSIREGQEMDIFQFINYLQEAFLFKGFFYSTSFYIQRYRSNYYAVFFISPNILGFEKIIEVNWELDPDAGQGFDLPKKKDIIHKKQIDMFEELGYLQENIKKSKRMQELEDIIIRFLSDSPPKNNQEMYRHVLENGFLPKHAKQILQKLREDSKLEVWDVEKNKPAGKRFFYLDHKYVNSNIKATYRLLE